MWSFIATWNASGSLDLRTSPHHIVLCLIGEENGGTKMCCSSSCISTLKPSTLVGYGRFIHGEARKRRLQERKSRKVDSFSSAPDRASSQLQAIHALRWVKSRSCCLSYSLPHFVKIFPRGGVASSLARIPKMPIFSSDVRLARAL